MSTRKTQLLRRAAGNERSRAVAITREEKALRAVLEKAGVGGAQPDWNQNDPNAPDYVKNRTHYEEFKAVIEEREVLAWYESREFTLSRTTRVGEKLSVIFDSETYECVVWRYNEEDSFNRVGNGEFWGGGGENVPFALAMDLEFSLVSTFLVGEHTISIVDSSGNTLLEETFRTKADDTAWSCDIPLDQSLNVGNIYKVVYDGVPYECVAWNCDDDIYLGAGEIDGVEHSEDVPFVIRTYYNNTMWYLGCYGGGTHTVSVSEIVVHKLDKKYLPNNMGGVVIMYDTSADQVFATPRAYEIIRDAFTNSIGIPIFVYEKTPEATFSGHVESIVFKAAETGGDVYFPPRIQIVAYARMYNLYEDGTFFTAVMD